MANRIFSLIGWLGTALVLGAVGIRFGLPAKDQYATYLAEGGLVCMLLYILSQWRDILNFFGRRQARYGTLALTSVLIALGILVAINYIGKRENKRWDLTVSKQFSLSDQSRNYVSKLDAPLTVRVFDKDINFQQYRDRLKEYEYASKQLKTEYIDPDRNPAAAQQYKVEQYGTMIFEYKGRSERVTADTEQVVLAVDHCLLWAPEMDQLLGVLRAGTGLPGQPFVAAAKRRQLERLQVLLDHRIAGRSAHDRPPCPSSQS